MFATITKGGVKAFEHFYSSLKDDRDKVDNLNDFCWHYADSMEFTDLCLEKAKQCSELLKNMDYPRGKAKNLVDFGYYHWAKSEYDKCLNYCDEAEEIFRQIQDDSGLALIFQIRATIAIARGKYDQTFLYLSEASKMVGPSASLVGGWIEYTLGIYYFELTDYNKSLQYYQKAQSIFEEIDMDYGIARSLSSLASVYMKLNMTDEAKSAIDKAISIFRELGHKAGLGRVLNDKGVMYRNEGEFDSALKFLEESYQLRSAIGHVQGIITTCLELGRLMIMKKDSGSALKSLNEGLTLARDTGSKMKESGLYRSLADTYKMMGQPDKAYENLENYTSLYREISGQEASRKVQMIETKWATDKAEKEAEIERLKNVELKNAHDAIAQKNSEILASIVYAKRIQRALMPPERQLAEYLESFILFKPKDIVAGDFYWIEVKDDKIYFAAADCTGHGVPGAMVSVMCSSALTKSLRELNIEKPSQILDQTVQILESYFSKSDEEVKDGMDLVLCCLDKSENTLDYAAANNPLYLVRNGELKEYKADKQPVGKFDGLKPFTNHVIAVEKGDCFYAFTDGFADQFGGPDNKKFKYSSLKKLILELNEKPMEEQRKIMNQTFEVWKGTFEQVDDVCVIGIRI